MGSSLVLNRRPKVPAEDTAAFGAIAERFRRAGALEQAVSLCRDGLKKFPDHVSARVTLGWSLLDLGKYDEARVELEQVMRRAPDNLAAIRGLAELHDRFEHTLNLPMDGPGQWPPPPDSVDGDAATAEAGVSQQFKAEMLAESDFSEPAMAPAAMGLPLWTPGPAAPPAEAAAAPVEAAATPVVSTPVASAPVAATDSGMSSVREIDAFAGAPVPAAATEVAPTPENIIARTQQPPAMPESTHDEFAQFEIDAPVVAMAEQPSDVSLGVSDDALAALIAEADSLDAAAALDLGVEDSLELGSVELQLNAPVDLAQSGSMELGFSSGEPVLESASELEPGIPTEVVAEAEIAVAEPISAAIEPELAFAEPQATVSEPEVALVEPHGAVVDSTAVAEPDAAVIESETIVESALAIAEPAVAVVEPVTAAVVSEVAVVTPAVVVAAPEAAVVEPEVVVVAEIAVVEAAVVEPEVAVAEPEVAALAELAVVAPELAVVEPEAAVVESEVAVVEPREAVVEPKVEAVETNAASTAEVIAFARPMPAIEHVEADATAKAAAVKSAAATAALERMLRRVQARRRELMTQSVA